MTRLKHYGAPGKSIVRGCIRRLVARHLLPVEAEAEPPGNTAKPLRVMVNLLRVRVKPLRVKAETLRVKASKLPVTGKMLRVKASTSRVTGFTRLAKGSKNRHKRRN